MLRETVTVSELDLALVNALQLRPRASWTELAPPLGVTAGTLARRWERLTGEGLAWVSAVPGREFVRPRCRPGSRARIAERLCAFEEAATIELTGPGSADLPRTTSAFPADSAFGVVHGAPHGLGRAAVEQVDQRCRTHGAGPAVPHTRCGRRADGGASRSSDGLPAEHGP
ncbi:AsnC family protein [Streptomyces sp. NPDC002523]